MRYKIFVPLLVVALVTSAYTFAGAQDQEENVRGAFIGTRPPSGGASVGGSAGVSTGGRSRRPRRTPPKNTSNRTTNKNSSTGNTSVTVKSNTNINATTNVPVNAYASTPIALGYSLFMRDESGNAVRVDPSREFRAGDRVRLSLETNVDGYLYVFYTENDTNPQMIFPDARLDEGYNEIDAHVPYEVPSSFETDERLRWFVFDNKPANERLYIVVTREPLPGIPIGDDLAEFCRNRPKPCVWQPTPGLWTQLKANINARVYIDKTKTYGQVQTKAESEATTRGLGLSRSAPEPSVIRMNAVASTGILVTVLDLIHK
jgi:hypothetical protein